MEWTATITESEKKNLYLQSNLRSFGRIIFLKKFYTNFKKGDQIKIKITLAKEPPPPNTYQNNRTVIYGVVHELINNGIVITKWDKDHNIRRQFWFEEILVLIEETYLRKSLYYYDDCIRISITKQQ